MGLFAKRAKPASIAPAPSRHHADTSREHRIHEIGAELLEHARTHKAGLLSKKFYDDKLMDWAMKDHAFKVQMFRFVDAFPTLPTPESIHEHLTDYLSQPGVRTPPGFDLAIKAGGVAKTMAAKTIAGQIRSMAARFIAGVDAADALPRLRELWKDGIAFSVDLLGEACISDAEAQTYQQRYLDLVENLTGEASTWSPNPRLEHDHLGEIPRVNVSVKASAMCGTFDAIDHDDSIDRFLAGLTPILEAAKRNNVFVNFDMEHHAIKDLTIDAFVAACERQDFAAGLAMQAYLRSGVDDAKRLASWAISTGRQVTVRLVKGAYWDSETIIAEENGWPCPVWGEKWQTDACFEAMTDVFLDACPRSPGEGGIKLALGSHNARSIAYALAGLEARDLPREAIELQMLHGMADQLKHAAAEMGLRVREYVPVGEMIPGMAYLVRRLLENTSNESWLRAGFLDNVDAETLLAKPARAPSAEPKPDLLTIAPERHALSPAAPGVGDGRPFFTEPTHDFADPAQRAIFARAVGSVRVPEVANDRTPEDADAMLTRAHAAFPAWRDADPLLRSRVLVRAADAMRARRDELAAIMVKEAHKTWREADAGVCEAIDFCDYYARTAPSLFDRKRLGRFIGELDETWYQPRGVCAVISPWNFPLAICCGMTAAALVTGNTVVMKPAEQTPSIAELLYTILDAELRDALGVRTQEILHFCPAPGETVGAAIVRDPRVAIIAFTGSKAVGLDIIAAAGRTTEDMFHVKQIVCEMGGKNAVIVDTSADLDEAVVGVRYSAFGFAGQKCSACSRCIVVDPQGPDGATTKLFLERLTNAVRTLTPGDPSDPGTDLGPVIDAAAHEKIRGCVGRARADGLEHLVGDVDFPRASSLANLIPPQVFAGVRPEHALAQEEVFGPVLAVMHAATFDEALSIANDHRYKLTGGVFTRRPAHIEAAKARFRVGNLYINRGCTGALVGRQPFGGFGLSGVGSKAGGADYLLRFVEPRASCENTMRRGFAPEL